jgi:hypothetical protein
MENVSFWRERKARFWNRAIAFQALQQGGRDVIRAVRPVRETRGGSYRTEEFNRSKRTRGLPKDSGLQSSIG